MKVKYYKEDDILVVSFSKKKVDDSFEVDHAILEVDKNSDPVSLEILDASKFLDMTSKNLPKEVKQKFFSV
jgi:uncharacterized protein YuzE